jgi:hypothetical protein
LHVHLYQARGLAAIHQTLERSRARRVLEQAADEFGIPGIDPKTGPLGRFQVQRQTVPAIQHRSSPSHRHPET